MDCRLSYSSFASQDVICHWTPPCFSVPSHWTQYVLLHPLTLLTSHCPKHVTWLSPDVTSKTLLFSWARALAFLLSPWEDLPKAAATLSAWALEWTHVEQTRAGNSVRSQVEQSCPAPQPRWASWTRGNKWWLFHDTEFGGCLLCTKSALIQSVISVFNST